jgi:bifunctional non-homologous end joining protein LigD
VKGPSRSNRSAPRAAASRQPRSPRASRAAASSRAGRTSRTNPSAQTDPALPALSFSLTHLDKLFFPRAGYTKGDLLRYYVSVADQILPVMRDRPLALKRYPNGVAGPFFFQQNAPAANRVPRGVRVEPVHVVLDGAPHPRIIGGTLVTLLYTIQLGCIGVDPWHARLATLRSPDYSVIDLDPGDAVTFPRIVEVALWVKAALDAVGLHGIAKTSGSRGIHIYIPLPAKASEAAALGVAQHIATRVAEAHPREATITRGLKGRGSDTVYVDYLQNARGKTVAAAYGVRAVDDARVSTPLDWSELTPTLDQHAFTLRTVPDRIARLGDIWTPAMKKRNGAAALRDVLGKGPDTD